MRARLDLGDEAGHRFGAPDEIFVDRREGAESLDAGGWKIGEARLRRLPLASLDDPLRDNAAGRFAVGAGFLCAREAGLAEAERHREFVLRGEADAILVVMIPMRESHEGRALELDDIGFIRMGQVLDERADIGAGVRVRWAEVVVVRIAERVARDRPRMQHAEPGVVQADRPAAHLQPARVAPAHELAKHVSAFKNDLGDLGLDLKPLPARGRRVKIDRAVLGKVDLSLRAARLDEAAGVIGRGETDAVHARAVAHFSKRRVVADVEKVPGVCPHRPVHSRPSRPSLAASEAERDGICQGAAVESASMR